MKYRMETVYIVRVDGRMFETSKTKERRDEIVEALKQIYVGSEITAEEKRRRAYK